MKARIKNGGIVNGKIAEIFIKQGIAKEIKPIEAKLEVKELKQPLETKEFKTTLATKNPASKKVKPSTKKKGRPRKSK